jgi:hypothetical protein
VELYDQAQPLLICILISAASLSFCQEIYNALGILVEVHCKYPRDLGHKSQDERENP